MHVLIIFWFANKFYILNPMHDVLSMTAHTSIIIYLWQRTKEEVNVFGRVCLFVCLSVGKITQKRVHEFGWNVSCRQMSGYGRTD